MVPASGRRAAGSSLPPVSTLAARLGYADDTKLVILSCDDLGSCHAANVGVYEAIRHGVATCTSLMVPAPWARHAAALYEPTDDVGVHLTLNAEHEHYRWGPLTPRERVPSLVDESGCFYRFERMAEFLAQVRLDELEAEFRAQIETVLAAGLAPTHLDWHALRIAMKPALFDVMFTLARAYGLALRVRERPLIARVQRQGLPVNDYDFLDSYLLGTADKSARFAHLLRDLPPGLSEWAVHPGLDDGELRAIEPGGAALRQADLDFLLSAAARTIIAHEGITLLNYQPLQEIWRSQ